MYSDDQANDYHLAMTELHSVMISLSYGVDTLLV